MSEKFTKGPWKVEADSDGQEMRIIAPQISYEVQPGERLRTLGYGCGNNFICDLNDMEYHEYTDMEEQMANGELLADAWQLPDLRREIVELKAINKEMYEALRKISLQLEEMRPMLSDTHAYMRNEMIADIKILLRKARGEPNL